MNKFLLTTSAIVALAFMPVNTGLAQDMASIVIGTDVDAGTLGNVNAHVPTLGAASPEGDALGEDPASWEGRVNRNAPCPCGSGRKYKHCHGAVGVEQV